MNEYNEINNILNNVRSRIDTHLKFKKEYDKYLALDFSLFHFFSMGENKVSEVLAYFLDVNQNHGQGDVFLREFIKTFYDKEIELIQLENVCEKTIPGNNRRIDIYLKFDGYIIAIENKIWASDQINQLKDYSAFLQQESKGNYLLLYLTPYGLEPTSKSIDEKLRDSLVEEGKLKIISYQHDIIDLINNWMILCEAENVSHFLKEFKKYLKVKFLGKNTLNMSKELRRIIFRNTTEVQALVKEYKEIEVDIESKIKEVGNELKNKLQNVQTPINININEVGPAYYYKQMYYKWEITNKGRIISMHFIRKDIKLMFEYSVKMQEDEDTTLEDIMIGLKAKNEYECDFAKSNFELAQVFLEHAKMAIESFRIYEEQKDTNSIN